MLGATWRTFKLISLSSTKRNPLAPFVGISGSISGNGRIAGVVVGFDEAIAGGRDGGIEEAEGTSGPGARPSGWDGDGGDWCHFFKVRSSILASFRAPGLGSICLLLATKAGARQSK